MSLEELPSLTGQRAVFVSHASADRAIAEAIMTLVRDAYSNVVRVFCTSDRTPQGGLLPGQDFYAEMVQQLGATQQVWLVATKYSVRRTWLHFEAGAAVAYGHSVVPICIDMAPGELPDPLCRFQATDGRQAEHVRELVEKVAGQFGMTLAVPLLEAVVSGWLEAVNAYAPMPQTSGDDVTPENLSRFERLLSDLQTTVTNLKETSPLHGFQTGKLPDGLLRSAPVSLSQILGPRAGNYIPGLANYSDPGIVSAIGTGSREPETDP